MLKPLLESRSNGPGSTPERKGVQSEGRPAARGPDWAELVHRIQSGDPSGMEDLYRFFSRGIRFYLCRQLGPQELEDKVHDMFVVVVQAIRRGELREPERLMGFVRTVVKRQIATHIEAAVQSRRDLMGIDSECPVADAEASPEDRVIARQRAEIMRSILESICRRDREVLTRFYLQEQSQEQICREMRLTETQFRLLKSRAKARFGELGRKTLVRSALPKILMRKIAGASH